MKVCIDPYGDNGRSVSYSISPLLSKSTEFRRERSVESLFQFRLSISKNLKFNSHCILGCEGAIVGRVLIVLGVVLGERPRRVVLAPCTLDQNCRYFLLFPPQRRRNWLVLHLKFLLKVAHLRSELTLDGFEAMNLSSI